MQQNIFTIFTGDTKTMSLKAIYEDSQDPLDLTSCTEIDVALPLALGGFAHLTITAGDILISTPNVLGNFTAAITGVVSALLKIGEIQSFDVTFTIAGKQTTVRYLNSFSVLER